MNCIATADFPVPRERDDLLIDMAEKAPVGLLQLDAEGVISWANAAHLELLGYERQQYVGRKFKEFFATPSEGAEMFSRLAGGETLRDFPAVLRSRAGKLRHVLIQANSDSEDGQLVRARLMMRDVTGWRLEEKEAQRLNQELEQRVELRTAQLEAANKEMESFSYSVSHDLRAPLRALRGFTEVLMESNLSQLDSSGQELLRRSCAAGVRMERLIEDLLKLARVSRAEIQIEEVDLSSLAKEIAEDLQASDRSRKVQFVIERSCKATGDPRLLRLALENLLSNAWKFSGRRAEARIEFGCTDAPEPAFFVRDNGAGFDMTFSKKLFGVFQRLHAVAEFPGTGVGLATVQRILHRHEGQIWAAAAVEQGATFYFTLPGMNSNAKPASGTHENIDPAIANSSGGGLGRRRPPASTSH